MNGLQIRDVSVRLQAEGESRLILDQVSLDIPTGRAIGLVGESGSGKSTLARTILRDLPDGAVRGQVRYAGRDVYQWTPHELRTYRSGLVALVGQNPRAAMNPVRRVGDFAVESLRLNRGISTREARARIVGLLGEVGIQDPERVMRQYPHQLSGGMLQRVVIAATLAIEPEMVVADEPTTALDVTSQAEVMAILSEQTRKRSMSLLLISHDLDLVAAVCDRTALMYAGRIVEEQPSRQLLDRPRHPYAAALAAARTRTDVDIARLEAIPGNPIAAYEATGGCSFAPRCSYALPGLCDVETPTLTEDSQGRVACLRHEEIAAELVDTNRPVA